MAFGLLRKRVPQPAAPAVEPKAPAPEATSEAAAAAVADADSARQILELLEPELGGMIRHVERAANLVAGGAEATTSAPIWSRATRATWEAATP
jgi:methyl-accepting chemotaxis protein